MALNVKQKETDLISLFDEFNNHYQFICSEHSCTEEGLKLVTAQKNKLTELNGKLREENKTLQTTVTGCQAQLHNLCDLQDEVRCLKKTLDEKDKKIQEQDEQWKKSIQILQTEMSTSLEDQKKSLTAHYQTEVGKLNENIQELQANKLNLEQDVQNLTKEKTTEMNSLMMNYENKLSKVNRQNAQYKQQQQLVVNQDVLRKKMQHMKASHDSETALLKGQISQLEQSNERFRQQLEMYQNGQSNQYPTKAQPDKQSSGNNRKRLRGKDWSLSLNR